MGRWQIFTSLEQGLISTGKTFAEEVADQFSFSLLSSGSHEVVVVSEVIMQQENPKTQGRNNRIQKKNKKKIPSIIKVSLIKFMESSSTQKKKSPKYQSQPSEKN